MAIPTLTTGLDNIAGTAGNDTIVGDFAANVATGVLDVATFGAFDTIDGGAGVDTLRITDTTNTTFTLPSGGNVKNVENLVVNHTANATGATDAVIADVSTYAGLQSVAVNNTGSAADATITTKSNVTSVTVVNAGTVIVTDSGTAATTADKLSSVSLTGTATAATINSDALTSLSLTNTAIGATINAAAATRALNVTLNNVTGGTVADAEATSLVVTASGVKSSGVTLNAAKATTVTLQADKDLTVADVNIAAAKSIVIAGDGKAVISATSTVTVLESINATNSTGGVTVTPALGTAVTFTGGAGKDAITVGATTKAISMGAGDDTVTVSVAVAAGGNIDGGAGTDTLAMTAANAATLSLNDTFSKGISGFEAIQVTSIAGANIIDMSKLINKDGSAISTVKVGVAVPAIVAPTAPARTETLGTTTVDESNSIVFTNLLEGQSVTVAGRVFTAGVGGATDTQVGTAMSGGAIAGGAVSGTLALWTATASTTATVVFTSTTPKTDVAAITTSVAGVAGGSFALNNLVSGGTVELNGVLAGASSVAIKDAAIGTADILSIKLNGTANLVNTAALTVASVETININATDSSIDTVTLTNPAVASKILLNAVDATTITVVGNHGVDFTGSTLTKVTTLDASGVVATGATSAATATEIATAGAVTFSSAVVDKFVTIKGGNGADVLSSASINGDAGASATFLATNVTASTIDGGAGNDIITGSAGKDILLGGAGNDTITGGAGADTLTGGAGNDIFKLSAATDSTLAKMDVITDFVANTFGQGTSGAANQLGATLTVASRTGDVIDLTSATPTNLELLVVGNAADAQTFLQNASTDTAFASVNVAFDSSTSKLYIDIDNNGTVDSVILLSGVTTITTAAFIV